MEKPSFSKKYTKAKEILNKLLKEQLNNRISNLESNSLKELAVLSTLSSSSNTILNKSFIINFSIGSYIRFFKNFFNFFSF